VIHSLLVWFGSPLTLLYAAGLTLSGFGIVGEVLVARRLYSVRDTAANLALYAGFFALNLGWAHGIFEVYAWGARHAIAHVTIGGWHTGQHGLAWEWVALVVAEDVCFYWFHRASHRVRILWASHVTHHSSQTFNLSVAFRQTWLPFLGVVFWLPLALVGFDPLMIMTVQVFSLFYQELLHTQLAPRLGPIEWIFNTPSHHAIHHGSNLPYIDKNYGGVLIIWDRLFGTFARRSEDIRFGLTKNLATHNPIVIAGHEWWAMLGDVWRRAPVGKVTAVLGPPDATNTTIIKIT
jgi:sterol desaturase/sphingolipid hydroxylase (fatty acid hydroxylase superfamily)